MPRCAIPAGRTLEVPRILSITYDETLLRTREMILEGAGHEVTSALGLEDGRKACAHRGFQLFILGHSIPERDKIELVARFRATNPTAPVIALTRAGEPRLKEVDAYLNPGDPEELLRAIARTLDPSSERRRSASERPGPRRVK